ncbi:hypothetical protein GYMLUDRAFT_35604 [Collybiopsis luxurians FD-317 M1]|nr:hypothetical protein GYMLUDRAFT_35604 [Collybiopsis luxurians FD-317 M1]
MRSVRDYLNILPQILVHKRSINSSQLARLIRLLLETHPNSFAAAAAASSFLHTASNSQSSYNVLFELDRHLCLGLGFVKCSDEREYWTWEDVLRAYIAQSKSISNKLPLAINGLIDYVHVYTTNTLSRNPISIPDFTTFQRLDGMSPKKAHEVTRMAAYVASIVHSLNLPVVYIVDVGAGQGHLAREMLRMVAGVRGVLALDGDEVIVEREKTKKSKLKGRKEIGQSYEGPKVTHKVGRITSAQGLVDAVDEWMNEVSAQSELREPEPTADQAQVVLVSLHGCGSLSLDVLRAFTQGCQRVRNGNNGPTNRWSFIASVTVPCCYNLLREADAFPLSPSHPEPSPSPFGSHSDHILPCTSNPTSSHPSLHSNPSSSSNPSNPFHLPTPLPPSAYHLAAQVPNMWIVPQYESGDSSGSSLDEYLITPSASLAVRKVVWRALLECVLVVSQRGSISGEVSSYSSPASTPAGVVGSTRSGRPGFIPPMDANTYFANNNDNNKNNLADDEVAECSRTGQLAGSELGAIGRLGRLPSRAYDSWDGFLEIAAKRMGLDLSVRSVSTLAESADRIQTSNSQHQTHTQSHFQGRGQGQGHGNEHASLLVEEPFRSKLERALGILHVLRCILGPLIESALLTDRLEWTRGELGRCDESNEDGSVVRDDVEYSVSLVPLFSQTGVSESGVGGTLRNEKGSGSARNMAVVVVPAKGNGTVGLGIGR